jgi:hypothetical protein
MDQQEKRAELLSDPDLVRRPSTRSARASCSEASWTPCRAVLLLPPAEASHSMSIADTRRVTARLNAESERGQAWVSEARLRVAEGLTDNDHAITLSRGCPYGEFEAVEEMAFPASARQAPKSAAVGSLFP